MVMYGYFAGEKESKPVSGRVKEIAEFMLSCVMEKIVSEGYASTLYYASTSARCSPFPFTFISVILREVYSPVTVARGCNWSFQGKIWWRV